MNKSPDNGKVYTELKLLSKMQRFCAYQERSVDEVMEKLKKCNLSQSVMKKMISTLVASDFLNDERFARTFVRGKFRIKKWGRRKIYFELKKRNISEQIIKKSFEEIGDEEYHDVIQEMIHQKWPVAKGKNTAEKRTKLGRYLISKGFEDEMVWTMLMEKSNKYLMKYIW